LLANLSYRTGRKLHWDDAREVTSDGDANAYLMRRFRKPWRLPRQKRPTAA
jgi:hypothetical protein